MEETQQLEECILEEDQLEAHSSDKSEPLARLRVFKNDYFPETEFPLYLGDNILGRDPSVCSPALNARSVSKQHAVISVSFLPGHQLADDPVTEALLWDLGSMNGTRKARFRLTPHVRYALVEGESVLLADLPCQYVSGQNVAKRESEGEASRASGEAGAKNSSPTPNITPCKGLSLGHTPSQPEKPLVSESESDDEKETRRKGAGMVPDLDLSAPTCSTFLSSSSNIVPESEDEISITPSHPGNNSSHHVLSKMQAKTLPRCHRAGLKMVLHDSGSEVEESILEESTDLDVEKKSGGNLGTVASLEESNKSIRTVSGAILDAHSPDEGHKRQPGCGSGGTDAVENRSSSVEGVPEEVNLEKLELTRDSETDAEAEDEIKEEGCTSPLSGNLYHLDSDTDVEEEDLPAPVCGAPADSTKATHRSQGEDEFHLGSDTDVEEEDGVGCSSNAGAVAGDKLFLDSDTDVEDNELISSALAPTKLLSDHARCLNRSKEVNQEPQLPKNDLPKPQELDIVSDTDTEDVSPGSVESKECQGLDNPFTTTRVVQGLEIKSDSESDAEVESTQMFASAAQVVPLAVGGPDETVKGQVAVGPGAFNTDSDTDVEGEDESSHAAHKRLQQISVTLQKCSTPKSSGVSEEETQAFVSAAEPFRCPFLPSIMKTKPCTEDEDEEFIVAETQSFVSDPPPENTDAKDAPLDATQLYTSNSPQGEQDEPTQNFSFQLGLSDSSSAQSGKPKCIGGFHPIQEEEDDDLSATQAYVPISTSLTGFAMQIGSDMEATQAYHIGMRRTEVNVESDLYSTNAAEISEKCSKVTRQMDFLADLSTADTEPVSILGVGLVEETKEGKREVIQMADTKTYSDIRRNENESIKSSISAKRGSVSADYTEEPIVQPVRRSIRGRSKAETNGKGQHKDKEKKDDETKEVKREEIGKRRGRRASKNQKGEMERLREEKIEDTELLDREESEQLGREKEDNEGLEKEEKELEKEEREESELLKRDENDRCIREKREKEERERFEREKKEREEMEQLEREKREKEEMERLERENREREEMERLERENREREEKERLEREKEREEKERLEREKEREEKELLEREKREREENERLGREENERLEREKREREENERLEREKRERDENERLEREKEREEKKRLEREEKERFEREKREREEKERFEREKREREEKERFEREKKEREEKEMLEREKREREEKERFEREKREREEEEMLEREKRERDESELLEREKEREEKKRLEREEKERFEREKRERECNERLQREENERQEKHKSERKDLDLKSLKIEKLEQEQHLEGKEKEIQSERPSRSRRPTKGGPGLCHTTAAGNAEPSGQDFTAGIAAGRGRTRSSSISSEKSTSCSGTQKQGSSRRSQRTSPQNPDSDQCALNKDLPAIKLSGRQKKRGIVTSSVEAEVPSTQAQGKVFSNNNGARRSSRHCKPENLDTTPPENIPSQEIILPNLSSKGRNGIKKCTNSELLRPNEDKSSSPPEHLSVQEEIGCNISNGRKRNLEDESEKGEDGNNFKMPKNRRKSQKVPNVTEMDTSEENKDTHQRLVIQRKGRASTVLTKKKKQEEEVKNERDKKDEAGSGSVERKVRGRRAVLQTTGSKKAEEQMEKSNNLPSPNSEDLESKDAVTEGPQTPSGRAPRKRGHPVNSPSAAKTPRRSTQTHLPKVLFTGVSDEAGEAVVPRLGGMMANGVTDMTHLVTDKVRRTVKFLCAVARGVPIVTTAWLNKCGKSGSFVTPDAFLVKDAEQEKKFGFCLKESLQAACSKPLLQDYEVHVTRSVKPEPAQMKDIITCSGARYLPKMPTVHKPLLVVISCMEDASLCRPALSASVPVVSAEFLLTGILQQKIDLDAHRLAGADFKNVVKAASKGKKK